MQYLGEIAALGTAVSWSACALFFTSASRRIGSFSMSHYRMLFGLILICAAQLMINGALIPRGISSNSIVLLAISGVTGFFMCDACLFQCYVDIGPRLGILIFNTYPFASAVLAKVFLGETLSPYAWLGMFVTMGGIIFVLADSSGEHLLLHRRHLARGIFLATSAVVLQAISFTVAKPAMTDANGSDPLTATLIRAAFGGASFWLVSLVRGRIGHVVGKFRDVRSMAMIFGGSVVGAFIGVWLSMVALKYAPVAIASTLMALMPVAILPMTRVVYKERVGLWAIVGAIVACLGVAILFNL
jgi:drug/metabolite transporter (DMT)-like permease